MSEGPAKLFSVIVPVYRDWHRLALCLQALERQTLSAELFEIVIANNEPDGLVRLERVPANARIVHEPRPGSYAARNTAVARSDSMYLAFTDSDCIPHPAWLEAGLAALGSSPDARVTGPVSIFREEGGSRHAYLYDLKMAFPQAEYARLGNCVTANLLVARSVFSHVGPFDERLSGGDSLWNTRATAMGVPLVYSEGVEVRHPARRSLQDIFRKRRRVVGTQAAHRKISAIRFVISRLTPPARRLLMLRKDTSWPEALLVFFMVWLAQLVEALEFVMVRLGIKRPNRA